MSVLFRAKASAGRVAIWEKPVAGDPLAPFDDPIANFDLIRFCSDFQYLSVTSATEVSVSHTLLAGASGTGYSVSNGVQDSGETAAITDGQIRVTTLPLVSHGLGYAPLFAVLNAQRIVSPGLVTQAPDTSRIRMVSAFATTTQISLREVAISSDDDLPADDQDYTVLVFADPAADAGKPFLRIKPDEEISFGWGKVSSEQRAIRRAAPGDATFYVPITRTLDIKNGAIRTISPIAGGADLGLYTGGLTNIDAIVVSY